ncbi:hypothetical protein ANO11243_079970 [Dothideomycetidae sp. 11243]|nr:hypothetical protein ANO11243_079970 [fungal sp. No.11243]
MLRYPSTVIWITQEDIEDFYLRHKGPPPSAPPVPQMPPRPLRSGNLSHDPQQQSDRPRLRAGPEHHARDAVTVGRNNVAGLDNHSASHNATLSLCEHKPTHSPFSPYGPPQIKAKDPSASPCSQNHDEQLEDAEGDDQVRNTFQGLLGLQVAMPRDSAPSQLSIEIPRTSVATGQSLSLPSLSGDTFHVTKMVKSRNRDRSQSCTMEPTAVHHQFSIEHQKSQHRPMALADQCDGSHNLQSSPLDKLVNHLKSMPSTLSCKTSPMSRYDSFQSPQQPSLLSGSAFSSRTVAVFPRSSADTLPRETGYHLGDQSFTPQRFTTIVGSDQRQKPKQLSRASMRRRSSYGIDLYSVDRRIPTESTPAKSRVVDVSWSSRSQRLRVYDDEIPAALQPQTPAELRARRVAAQGLRPVPAPNWLAGADNTSLHPAVIPPGESRYPLISGRHAAH